MTAGPSALSMSMDEFTRESLAIRVRRKLSSADVLEVLTDLFLLRGVPAYIRSDNGPEFVTKAVRRQGLATMRSLSTSELTNGHMYQSSGCL